MKRLFLELGGKSAAIVLDDADLAAASMIAFGVCMHAGRGAQRRLECSCPGPATTRVSNFSEGIYETVTVGDPQLPDTLCGPVISAKQRARVIGYIEKGVAEGATLLVGGPGTPEGCDRGFYVSPSLFVDVDNSMSIAREEIFGPVLGGDPL